MLSAVRYAVALRREMTYRVYVTVRQPWFRHIAWWLEPQMLPCHLLAILPPDRVDPFAVAGAFAALEAPFGCFLSTRMLTLL